MEEGRSQCMRKVVDARVESNADAELRLIGIDYGLFVVGDRTIRQHIDAHAMVRHIRPKAGDRRLTPPAQVSSGPGASSPSTPTGARIAGRAAMTTALVAIRERAIERATMFRRTIPMRVNEGRQHFRL